MSFSFHTTIEGPSDRPHLVRCEGYWTDSDGDEIRPGYRYFHPETVEFVSLRGSRRRLQQIPNWLWEILSYRGEDSWRDMRDDAMSERWEVEDAC